MKILISILEYFHLRKCQRCGWYLGYTRRQHTQYPKDEMNMVTLCEMCHEENDEYWDDMWSQYWSDVL